MEVGVQRHVPAALPPGKKPGTYFIRGWVGSRACLDGYGKSRPLQGYIKGFSLLLFRVPLFVGCRVHFLVGLGTTRKLLKF